MLLTKKVRAASPLSSWIAAPLTLVIFLALVSVFTLGRWSSQPPKRSQRTSAVAEREYYRRLVETVAQPTRTLVTYIYSDTNTEYLNNLRFFLRWGIREDDGADYIIVVQQPTQKIRENDLSDLPPLPSNARYLPHRNECYDWGTFGWLMRSEEIQLRGYKYFVIVNSSVRGPFIPPYVPADTPWHRLLTQKLTMDVKMVGPTISCEGAFFAGKASNELRTNPHVQSFVLAMDQEALDILNQDAEVLGCWTNRFDAIWYAELGASKAILDAGFNLDCFLSRYQGIDWRDKGNWGCNARVNPIKSLNFDGLDLFPHDVLFIKFKEGMGNSTFKGPQAAVKYGKWLEDQEEIERDIGSNDFVSHQAKYRVPLINAMLARDSSCFDAKYYVRGSEDLKGMSSDQAWEHFVEYGQFEGRAHRFTCEHQLFSNIDSS